MTFENNTVGAAARRASRDRRLGPNPVCTLCTVSDPDALTRVKRSLLQAHHLAGRANDRSATVLLCMNCHAAQSAGQRDAGVFDKEQCGPILTRVINALRSLAVFAEKLPGLISRLADLLEQLMFMLDAHCPQWRTLILEEDLA